MSNGTNPGTPIEQTLAGTRLPQPPGAGLPNASALDPQEASTQPADAEPPAFEIDSDDHILAAPPGNGGGEFFGVQVLDDDDHGRGGLMTIPDDDDKTALGQQDGNPVVSLEDTGSSLRVLRAENTARPGMGSLSHVSYPTVLDRVKQTWPHGTESDQRSYARGMFGDSSVTLLMFEWVRGRLDEAEENYRLYLREREETNEPQIDDLPDDVVQSVELDSHEDADIQPELDTLRGLLDDEGEEPASGITLPVDPEETLAVARAGEEAHFEGMATEVGMTGDQLRKAAAAVLQVVEPRMRQSIEQTQFNLADTAAKEAGGIAAERGREAMAAAQEGLKTSLEQALQDAKDENRRKARPWIIGFSVIILLTIAVAVGVGYYDTRSYQTSLDEAAVALNPIMDASGNLVDVESHEEFVEAIGFSQDPAVREVERDAMLGRHEVTLQTLTSERSAALVRADELSDRLYREETLRSSSEQAFEALEERQRQEQSEYELREREFDAKLRRAERIREIDEDEVAMARFLYRDYVNAGRCGDPLDEEYRSDASRGQAHYKCSFGRVLCDGRLPSEAVNCRLVKTK